MEQQKMEQMFKFYVDNGFNYKYFITLFDVDFNFEEFIKNYHCKNSLVGKEICPKTGALHYHMYCESPIRMRIMVNDIKSKGQLKEVKNQIAALKYVWKGEIIINDLDSELQELLLP